MAIINSRVLLQAGLQLGISINIGRGGGDIEQGLAKVLPDAPAWEEWPLVYLPRSDHVNRTAYPRSLRRLCTVHSSPSVPAVDRPQETVGEKERSP